MYDFEDKKLIGAVITAFTLSLDKEVLTLHTPKGNAILRCISDCCSETWIEHLETPKLPATILSVEHKDLGECASDGTRQEHDEKYSTILKTDQGDFEIEFRNSSNGYYGGWLELTYYPDDVTESPVSFERGKIY